MRLVASLFLIGLAPHYLEQAEAAPANCLGFENGPASEVDVDHIYSDRAVTIVRLALANDVAALTPLIRSDADVSIWRGDYNTSARQKGVAGVIEMVDDLKPVSFQTYTVRTGPIVVDLVSGCGWSVDLLWRTSDPLEGVLMSFSFEDGELIKARGNQVSITEGNVR